MKVRIRELAEQANIHFSRVGILDGDPNGSARLVGYSKMEKFAELIMKETFDWVVDNVGLMENAEWEALKKHFGVE